MCLFESYISNLVIQKLGIIDQDFKIIKMCKKHRRKSWYTRNLVKAFLKWQKVAFNSNTSACKFWKLYVGVFRGFTN